ncbi:histone H1 [Mucilaginibacter paludis]|uniref:Histone H1 n=1 Tax=Mucilaginibacter paludis DSM 18603 TaxID=714943 RepID=H1Y5A3_9SPHI|nr:histone H1 [Mucilaginibacter paludis]EHQ28914.1 hypothetical protein Mucpa_4829 [Mucilaginibacter paludis DSM 18603]
MSKFKDLKSLLEGAETDAVKFYDNGNKAAGTRLRARLQLIKKIAQEIRVEVGELKKKKE